jgi:transcriptional antiterminator RfaH
MDHIEHRAPQWFALRVKSRHEQIVAFAIREKGFDEFLPLYARTARWSDRTKTTRSPLFPGYVFCRVSPKDRLPILTIPGTLHFVARGKELVPIDEEELLAIQIAVQAELNPEPIEFQAIGTRLQLSAGPLAGVQGFLGGTSNYKLVISLTSLQRSVAVEIKAEWAGIEAEDDGTPRVATRASGR